MFHFFIIFLQPYLNTVRGVNMDDVILEHRTFSWKESLKHRVKRICEIASAMVVCDPPPQDNEKLQSMGSYSPHTITEPPPCFMVEIRQST
ncbi:hypothetical protein TNCV_999041 [Trichonephila clavipes]|nr:hypothetical protein TNCV_999041 [Trichonephila clavipes]